MGMASHLGPWLLGTVKSTTGTSTGQIRNMGATVVAQSTSLSYTDTTAKTVAVVPAGALITSIIIDVTQAFNAGTNNTITIQTGSATTGSNVVASGTALSTYTKSAANIALGRATPDITSGYTYASTASVVTLFTNVGTTDLVVQAIFAGTGTAASTGTATVTVQYVVRNSDGTYNYSSTSSVTTPAA